MREPLLLGGQSDTAQDETLFVRRQTVFCRVPRRAVEHLPRIATQLRGLVSETRTRSISQFEFLQVTRVNECVNEPLTYLANGSLVEVDSQGVFCCVGNSALYLTLASFGFSNSKSYLWQGTRKHDVTLVVIHLSRAQVSSPSKRCLGTRMLQAVINTL
jgi:hypothetical protein